MTTRTATAVLAATSITILFGAPGCAPRHVVPASQSGGETVRANPAAYVTIVAMRPLPVPASTPAGAAVIGLIGHAGAVDQATGAGAVEFIIRGEAGQPLSVVQTNEAQLRPGERIMLVSGVRARLVRAAASGT
jgi:outer membrane lipoprotein SlyB